MMLEKLLYEWPELEVRNMMELTRVRIEGFRNISSISLNFSSITALVSMNSYGKSNVLTGIDFAVDFLNAPKEIKKKMMSWTNGIPLTKEIESKDFLVDFEFIMQFNNTEYIVNYGYSFAWIHNSGEGRKIVGEWLRVKQNVKGQKFTQLISRKNNKAFYKSSETGRCTTNIKIGDDELVLAKLNVYDSLYYVGMIEQIFSVRIYIDRHLDSSELFEPEPIIRKGFDDLEINGIRSIPRAIYFLKKEYPNKYKILLDAYMQLFPNVESVKIRSFKINTDTNISDDVPYIVTDKIYRLIVQDKNLNQPISFERLSDGAKRVFLMLTYAIIADIKGLSLIAFEEPENSIHPALLQSYLRVMNQLTEKCKIVFTSHSPYIIQYLEPINIYIGIPNNNGVAKFSRIIKEKAILKDSMDNNESLGNYIFDLLSGNEDELDELSDYLE